MLCQKNKFNEGNTKLIANFISNTRKNFIADLTFETVWKKIYRVS